MIRQLVPFVLTLALTNVGCKTPTKLPPLNPVKGRVTKGNTPIPHATVILVPEKPEQQFTISGMTDEQGNVVISTIEGRTNIKRPGAREGTYVVKVVLPPEEKQPFGWILPDKFTVQKGDNSLPAMDIAAKK